MKIAFILDHALMHYRVPFFNLLSYKYGHKIVVYHGGKRLDCESLCFRQIVVNRKRVLKIFDYRANIEPRSFDIVVCMQNMRLLNLWALCFTQNRGFKFIQWGIGVSSSEGLNSQSGIIRIMRNFLMGFADAVVFYSVFPLKYVKKSHKSKSFVALNSVENRSSQDLSSFHKDSFIFIGSLNKRKGLREIIAAFHKYLRNDPLHIKKLFIIGEGEEYEYLSQYVELNNLQNQVLLLGKIERSEDKIIYFRRSIASISLNQAGLSVLESFSYGVPFITKRHAISGGEHLNIKNFENGFLVDDMDDFVDKLDWMDKHVEEAGGLGKNAFTYYSNVASMDLMVEAFEKAIRYVGKS